MERRIADANGRLTLEHYALRMIPMENMKQRLVGFTARKTGYNWRTFWPPERANTYLLNSEKFDAIYSLDETCWPSVFSSRLLNRSDLNEHERKLHSGPPEPTDWIGAHNPLWSDLDSLRTELARHEDELWRPYVILGVTVVAAEHETAEWGLLFPDQIRPDKVLPDWKFLGFDICDEMLSGLTNCGYKESDFKGDSREVWAKKLNSNHLFDELDTALSFSEFTNLRVEEHAPFLVVGLYEVELVTS